MASSKDGQGHKDRYLDTSRKILSQEMLRCNMKSLALTVQKLLARLKFQRGGQNDRQDKYNMPPNLRSRGHKNYMKIQSPLCKQGEIVGRKLHPHPGKEIGPPSHGLLSLCNQIKKESYNVSSLKEVNNILRSSM